MELLAWCVGGAVLGFTLGAALARPEEAFDGLRDALVQVGTMVAQGLRGLWSWRP